MRGQKPSPQELAQLDEWQALRDTGMNCTQIGARYDVTGDTVRSKLHRYNTQWRNLPREFQVVDLGKPLELEGDWMIIGDVHVPTVNYELNRLMLAVARKHLKNPRLIIAGDLFSQDSFSRYEPTVSPPSFDQECEAAKKLMSEWLGVFSEIVAIQGNHDRRVTKSTIGAITAHHIFSMVTSDPKLKVSNFGWLTINTDNGPYRVTHSQNYSINRLTVASELANKFQAHIVEFHEHHLAIGWDKFGHYLIINGGGLFDDSQLAYVVLEDNKSPKMTPGFVMLRGGFPFLFGRAPFTDWAKWI